MVALPRSKARKFVRGFVPYRRYHLDSAGFIVVTTTRGRALSVFRLRFDDLVAAMVWLCTGTWP